MPETPGLGVSLADTENATSAEIALVLDPRDVSLRGIRHWEQAALLLVESKTHPRFTARITAPLVRALARFADHTTGADIRPTWARLMAEVGCSRRSLAYHLRHLQEAGLLVRVYHGTHLPGGTTMASVYAARLPGTALVRTAADEAQQLVGCANRERVVPSVSGRSVTCPAATARAARSRRTVARVVTRGQVSAGKTKICTPPRGKGSSTSKVTIGFTCARTDKAAATRTARDLAVWLTTEVNGLSHVPVGWLANVLRPHAAAGWTRDDLATWLGLRPVPRWYTDTTGTYRGWLPWRLPARITRPCGLLAHRLRGLSGWRAWEPLADVRARAAAASRAAVDAIAAPYDAPADVDTEQGQVDEPALTGPAAVRAAHRGGRTRARAQQARQTRHPTPAPEPVPVVDLAPVRLLPASEVERIEQAAHEQRDREQGRTPLADRLAAILARTAQQ